MQKQIKLLETFQKAFKSNFNTAPTFLTEGDYNLRYALAKEENEEYLEAYKISYETDGEKAVRLKNEIEAKIVKERETEREKVIFEKELLAKLKEKYE